eukprot:CAMPEP_0178951700 /NCGR_PEP_ID=MMETSP0789-20121207/7378_1 /TAXON_ID=3005 /ORGANISM="Rhizosolenia setigera, Strain CCMP 1694" /LENGTH=343 /DNA_ID=CAMNT_0020632615 /DNA_START=121 /DNA_END=1155 /DNA_ORIENTATION=+
MNTDSSILLQQVFSLVSKLSNDMEEQNKKIDELRRDFNAFVDYVYDNNNSSNSSSSDRVEVEKTVAKEKDDKDDERLKHDHDGEIGERKSVEEINQQSASNDQEEQKIGSESKDSKDEAEQIAAEETETENDDDDDDDSIYSEAFDENTVDSEMNDTDDDEEYIINKKNKKNKKKVGSTFKRFDAPWEKRFNELSEFKRKHGHCLVNQKKSVLGRWVQNMRMYYKPYKFNKKPPSETSVKRIEALDSIGFVWDVLENAWESNFKKLIEYKKIHGDCRVPTGYKRAHEQRSKEMTQLGEWVNAQRIRYRIATQNKRSKKKSALGPEHIKRLESIGFVWEPMKQR